ncbi:hypothetical protein [Paenirhodobacter enshiensis]|uniref:hypothetical protein n=1 Tax=Paenirhodobacter enshiensis TaxID=1105367 RepID=UPI0035AE4BB0
MKAPEPKKLTPARTAQAASKKPQGGERKSIFDISYAPEGAELRKPWSRFDRKTH